MANLNSERKLTDDLIADLREIFCVLDKDKANKLGASQACEAFQRMGIAVTMNEVRSMMVETCVDKESVLFEELITMMEVYKEDLLRGAPMRLAFKLMDKNGTGYIDKSQLKRVFGILGESDVDDAKMEKLIRETSLFGYDKFNFLDFMVKLMKK
jgi:Ca2+-binding EF-hand superfamily protein